MLRVAGHIPWLSQARVWTQHHSAGTGALQMLKRDAGHVLKKGRCSRLSTTTGVRWGCLQDVQSLWAEPADGWPYRRQAVLQWSDVSFHSTP